MIKIQPKYKFAKELKPFCPVCKERLKGSNAYINPWHCSCGVWKLDLDNPMSYIIEDKK